MFEETIIAEIGSVHDGSFGNALKLIEVAAECGADAVKFQTHLPLAETRYDAPSPSYFKDESRFSYFERTSFSKAQWKDLKKAAEENGLIFLSSPFSIEAVELLEDIGMVAYKIPSGEVNNIPMLEKIAELKKPVLLSSGMSDWNELTAAYQVLKGEAQLAVLQCSSSYPCLPESVGLNVISEIKQKFDCDVGLSDHTLGYSAAVCAVALGATVIEKHLTFSNRMYGSDAKHSMEPDQFTLFCDMLRDAWLMANSQVDKDNLNPYIDMKATFQKSIVAAKNLPKNKVITSDDLAYKKPGTGISADRYQDLIGKTLLQDLQKDDFLDFRLVK